MIKSIFKKSMVALLAGFMFMSSPRAAATTLQDLKDELASLKSEKAINESKKSKTQSEINQQNANIASANAEITQAEADIELAKTKIEESNRKIDKTKLDSEELLVFYQMMQGEDDFLQYISGATSMTQMMMRGEAVSQIVGYNQDSLTALEEEIVENNQLQIELKEKEEDLKSKIKTYENSVVSLKGDLASLVEVTLDYDQQIQAQKELIQYYENMGCKDNQNLSDCVSDVSNNSRFLRPLNSGYISSGFGYRSFYLNGAPYSDFHNGVDIAGNAGGTNIYSPVNGTVVAVIERASCGGNQIYMHARVGGQAYTLNFCHLMDVYVGVGDTVTTNTVIGTVGGGGRTIRSNGGWDTCSTGYHLHYAVATGFYLGGGSEGYSNFNTFVAKCIVPPNMPGYGGSFYSRY